MHLGRGLRHLPTAEAAWLAGDIGRGQVAALAGARNARTEDTLARDEEMLVGQAKVLRHDQFVGCRRLGSEPAEVTVGRQ